MDIITIEGLSHSYNGGKTWANKDIFFNIPTQGVVALLGSNGAGKSTLMNIICGVLNQSKGIVKINGSDIKENPNQARKQLGFLPQTPPLYLDLTVDEYLTHCARIRLMNRKDIPEAVAEVKRKVNITHFSKRLIKNLSGGYRQRVGIAQAIIHKPKLVILDEPTIGLDPNQIIEVRKLVSEIALQHTVLFSTHILHEVDLMCTHVLMMETGQLIFNDTIDAFRNIDLPESMLIHLQNMPAEQDMLTIEGVTKIEKLSPSKIRLFFNENIDISKHIIQAATANNWGLLEIHFERKTLDAIFSQLSSQAL